MDEEALAHLRLFSSHTHQRYTLTLVPPQGAERMLTPERPYTQERQHRAATRAALVFFAHTL